MANLAIASGKSLCEQVLEPIQQAFGRIGIRSGYRSSTVNAKGAENKNQYNCASNEFNYAVHIWDILDTQGYIGATACIIVNSFIDYYERTADWTALAWWIHDRIDSYKGLAHFNNLVAVYVSHVDKIVFTVLFHLSDLHRLLLHCESVLLSRVLFPSHTQLSTQR